MTSKKRLEMRSSRTNSPVTDSRCLRCFGGRGSGLGPFAWTDPVLTPGETPVRLAHLLELREALAAVYEAAGRPAPRWTDAMPAAGTTPIRAVHLTELRAALIAIE